MILDDEANDDGTLTAYPSFRRIATSIRFKPRMDEKDAAEETSRRNSAVSVPQPILDTRMLSEMTFSDEDGFPGSPLNAAGSSMDGMMDIAPEALIGANTRLNQMITIDNLPEDALWLRNGWMFYRVMFNFEEKVFFFISPFSKVRLMSIRIVSSRKFASAVLLLILLNAVTLAMDTPENASNYVIASIVDVADDVFFACFACEAILKMIAFGVIMHEKSYLRNMWNVLDFLIVLEGVSRYFLLSTNLSSIRMVRVMRPLRTISRIAGLKLIVSAVFKSFSLIVDVALLLIFLLLMFAVLGLQIYNGVMRNHCVVPPNKTYSGITRNETFIISDGRACGTYRNCQSVYLSNDITCVSDLENLLELQNFDYIWTSLLAVIQVTTMDDWTDVMNPILDATSPVSSLFFIGLILISYFCVNLFLAVLVDEFTVLREEQQLKSDERRRAKRSKSHDSATTDPLSMTSDPAPLMRSPLMRSPVSGHRRSALIVDQILPKKLSSRNLQLNCFSKMQSFARRLIERKWYSAFLLVVTLVNLCVLAADHNGIQPDVTLVFDNVNFAATIVFMADLVTKLFGLGPKQWFADRFNVVDGALVAVSVIEMGMTGGKGSTLSALRTLRVVRVMTYMSTRFTSVRAIFLGILSSIQAVLYVV
eukprot:PhF_6_TR42976/c0_g2_i1/m.65456